MITNLTRLTVWGFVLSLVLIFSTCQNKSNPSSTSQNVSFLTLGDSYTIGESVEKNDRWPIQLADSLRNKGFTVKKPTIIAETGWTTEDLRQAIEKENLSTNYDLVSLLIGVNNQYQGLNFIQFEKEFEKLVKQAITFADGNEENVFVVSIPNYGVTPFGQSQNPGQIREELNRYNQTAKDIATEYNVSFINITPISEKASDNPELTADDDLHPSGEMYQRWVGEILPVIISKL